MRDGLKMICAKFGEDWTKYVVKYILIQSNMAAISIKVALSQFFKLSLFGLNA